jgi:hypothetical protein
MINFKMNKIDEIFILRKRWQIVCCVIGAGSVIIRIENY